MKKYTRLEIATLAVAITAFLTSILVIIAGFYYGWGFPNAYMAGSVPNPDDDLMWFAHGMWDAVLFPFSIIGMFFCDSISPVSMVNNGIPYWLGFALAIFNWGLNIKRKSE